MEVPLADPFVQPVPVQAVRHRVLELGEMQRDPSLIELVETGGL
jgi:hypothetical protein